MSVGRKIKMTQRDLNRLLKNIEEDKHLTDAQVKKAVGDLYKKYEILEKMLFDTRAKLLKFISAMADDMY